jgi:hypothetical protein
VSSLEGYGSTVELHPRVFATISANPTRRLCFSITFLDGRIIVMLKHNYNLPSLTVPMRKGCDTFPRLFPYRILTVDIPAPPLKSPIITNSSSSENGG